MTLWEKEMSYEEMRKEIQIKLDLIKKLWYNDIKLKEVDVTQKLHGCIIRYYVENGPREKLNELEDLLRSKVNKDISMQYYYVYIHEVRG